VYRLGIAGVQLYSEHQYKSDFSAINFGREFDFNLAYRFAKSL
jgi:hypothetical protein